MDALSDTLKDIRPTPEPAPVLPKDVVKVNNKTSKENSVAVDHSLDLMDAWCVHVIFSGEGGGGGEGA